VRLLRSVVRQAAIAAVLAALLAAPAAARKAPSVEGDEPHFLESERDEFAADADADTYAGPAPLTVRFTSSTINGSGRTTYAWDFDDGSRSGQQNPTHTFRKRGWYLVSMVARDGAGRTYRTNLLVHAWRPRDWMRLQQTRDMRIVRHAARELERKRSRAAAATEPAPPPSADGRAAPP
jgi:hypothetical protein